MTSPAILVTGGAGFIGSHVCELLSRSGFTPVVVDNLSSGHRSFVQWGPFFDGHCGDSSLIRHICATHHPVACIHFAGLIEVGRSVQSPGLFYDQNVSESVTLFNTLQDCGVTRTLFSSTAAVYHTQSRPIRESDPINPTSPYGRTKRMVETILDDLARAHGSRYICLRYFNAAGGHPTASIGESHHPETHLIPSLLDYVYGRRPSFTIFGTDYPTSDGTCIRDYIHVLDLAEAHRLALLRLLSDSDSCIFNVGTGIGASIREIITAVETVTQRPITPIMGPQRPGDCAILVADSSAIQSQWGWRPHHSSLTTIIADAWRWRNHINPTLDRA